MQYFAKLQNLSYPQNCVKVPYLGPQYCLFQAILRSDSYDNFYFCTRKTFEQNEIVWKNKNFRKN